jgi:putative transposase
VAALSKQFTTSTNRFAYQVGPQDMKRVIRLCDHLDRLNSKRAKAPNAKKRYSYRRATRRLNARIHNIVNEVHRQLAKHLATHYDLVMLPTFQTSKMLAKETRNINAKTARQMACWSHYRFKQRLLFKCREYGCKVVIVDEGWTSKTCSCCGTVDYSLGSA